MNKDSKKKTSKTLLPMNEQLVSIKRLEYLRKLENKYSMQMKYYKSELDRVRDIIHDVEISMTDCQTSMF